MVREKYGSVLCGKGIVESRTVVLGQGEAQCSGKRYGDGVVQCDTVL